MVLHFIFVDKYPILYCMEEIIKYLYGPATITVDKLCKEGFNLKIPSYQRGYRWTKNEVERLLEDVYHYSHDKDGDFYCLQPLVVRHIMREGTHEWKVIDGQQRLTTIYMILKAIGDANTCYSLEYEREKILDSIYGDKVDVESSCEVWHLSMARKAIDDWIGKGPDQRKKVLKENIRQHCRFILYVMKECEQLSKKELDVMEHTLFNNLNSGKISLTESELIKALFLHHVGEIQVVKEVKQVSMSEELDFMERTLREDEMWYFLAGDQQKSSSCIDYLYKVWYLSVHEEIPKDADHPIFSSLEESIISDKEMIHQWKELKKCFHIITGWYQDPVLYNLIGYLEGRKRPKYMAKNYPPFHEDLLAMFYRFATSKGEKSKLPTRKEFLNYVKKQCMLSIPERYLEARFDKDKNEVFNILLLLNVAMLVNHKRTSLNQESSKSTGKGEDTKVSRFPFHVFHTLNWNVEHISPQNPKDNADLMHRLEAWKSEYIDQSLPQEIEKIYQMLKMHENNLSVLDHDADYINLAHRFVAEKEDVMCLGNLTLLTEHNNKGIGNKFYFDKRICLHDYQSQGSFIPAATLQVFSKWNTDAPNGFVFWDENDQEAYQNAIVNTIDNFIDFCEDHVSE